MGLPRVYYLNTHNFLAWTISEIHARLIWTTRAVVSLNLRTTILPVSRNRIAAEIAKSIDQTRSQRSRGTRGTKRTQWKRDYRSDCLYRETSISANFREFCLKRIFLKLNFTYLLVKILIKILLKIITRVSYGIIPLPHVSRVCDLAMHFRTHAYASRVRQTSRCITCECEDMKSFDGALHVFLK